MPLSKPPTGILPAGNQRKHCTSTKMPETTCAALDWKPTNAGKDYVPCTSKGEVEEVELLGTMLRVKVRLCRAHQKFFEKECQVVTLAKGSDV